MSLVTRLRKSIAEAREQENMRAAIDKQQALIEFLAIMADVDIDEEGDTDEEYELREDQESL